ncbi:MULTISPECIES: bifunctional diaminohydroxyphosphoribosylaminopyrimidine deaminase/5-amino-6-(5-phosphoribosylamino)uracil reductase RibD [Metallibacterium]|jgi:diaminohydroxyphosphoribosylaminopyrimidine deaminase/5-amino-6-(5-phosphoribosylamino)uracil reductase|uniref:bifunctional diaminohydroxyphosphoribosylaminopyrimidine deaminase/5-amino-6-(5-phosphoribosylamino)uracil reductase RibD n=1 Tax=Metallibacterium TaxID=1218803 RepID=UPI00261E03A4|nr:MULTISPECIES: bifunctional diaminohydroxyphosphoribosylaminopyrimidine deaminase/5-amino-6-(5-phosphoribosylamino)uracil reductase RibD [Metallibacterium]
MSACSAVDHAHMAEALRLAQRGLYTTQPNPRVGCVIARGAERVGEGFHARAGEPHAEVHALRACGERARGATAYVTLEPCAHHGRTPPCADALVQAGVARVVVACSDPFPRVAGAGIARLRDAGITVDAGLMQDAARELNRGFFSRIERDRPWLRLKLAMSLDGRTALADGRSFWITGEAARSDVARWRARSSAILTGAGTVRADDPHLTVRLDPHSAHGDGGNLEHLTPRGDDRRHDPRSPRVMGRGEGVPLAQRHESTEPSSPTLLSQEEGSPATAFVPPLRVLLDTRLDALHASAHLLDAAARTLILHAPGATPAHAAYARAECVALPLRDGRLDLHATLTLLAARGCNEVQVEAGAALAGALLHAGLVDELLLYIAPVLLGDSARPLLHLPTLADMAARWQLRTLDQRMLGEDMRLLLRPT